MRVYQRQVLSFTAGQLGLVGDPMARKYLSGDIFSRFFGRFTWSGASPATPVTSRKLPRLICLRDLGEVKVNPWDELFNIIDILRATPEDSSSSISYTMFSLSLIPALRLTGKPLHPHILCYSCATVFALTMHRIQKRKSMRWCAEQSSGTSTFRCHSSSHLDLA